MNRAVCPRVYWKKGLEKQSKITHVEDLKEVAELAQMLLCRQGDYEWLLNKVKPMFKGKLTETGVQNPPYVCVGRYIHTCTIIHPMILSLYSMVLSSGVPFLRGEDERLV